MSANELILVTGGTGNLGRRVVDRLRKAGRKVRVLSRGVHEATDGIEYAVGDLARGEGVGAAGEGASLVIRCAGVGKIKEGSAQARNLVKAAKHAGVKHFVTISVVGADRIPVKSGVDRAMFAYFASQLAKERVVAESGLPWTNLPATQFHDGFILAMVRGMSKLPIVPLPTESQFQPVNTDEVADNLVQLALGTPAGQAPDIGGPKIYDAEYLLRSYLEAVGKRRVIVRVRMPGAAAGAIRAGANLTPDRARRRPTWEEFLAPDLASPPARVLKGG